MNSNLRSMIEDALDGELQDETFSYDSYEDVPSAYGGDEITKLASALNFVATNLDDLGTTDEKLAELELLHEKIANATEKAATDAAEDTLGAFYKNLKGGSGKSLSDAFGALSTGRKFAVGGGAGLVGLGALYGGAKMLGGGDKQTNVVKVSSLQEAKQRALVKMAEHYNIPVWELEKIAATEAQGNLLNFRGELSQKQIDILRGDIDAGRLSAKQKAFFDKIKPGMTITGSDRDMLKKELVKNPTMESMIGNSPEAVAKRQANIERLYGGAEQSRITRRLESRAVKRDHGAMRNISNLTEAQIDQLSRKHLSADTVGKLTGKNRELAARALRGDSKAMNQLINATSGDSKLQADLQRGMKDMQAEARSMGFESGAKTKQQLRQEVLEQQRARPGGAKSQRMRTREQLQKGFRAPEGGLGRARGKAESDLAASLAANPEVQQQQYGRRAADQRTVTQEVVKKRGGDTKVKTTTAPLTAEQLKTQQETQAKLQQQLAERKANKSKTVTPEVQAKFDEMKKQREAKVTARSEADATARAQRKAGGQAAEKELGFLAKNRRALLGAGALGAAGLAGYGAYRAFGGGGQSKAASYRGRLGGMRKLAEDRINPARIHAGKADPFSGMDIHRPGMSRSASPLEPIGIKAQRIRDQINADMQGYVSNVGGGYNLNRYLNKFNK